MTAAARTESDFEPEILDQVRFREHRWCFACGEQHPFGLKLRFQADLEDGIVATFGCGKSYEGFHGHLHGGIVSTLLDSAMVSWLMSRGVSAQTADLNVRFHRPIEIGIECVVRAVCRLTQGPIHRMEAQILQQGLPMASAKARFFETKRERLELNSGSKTPGAFRACVPS